MTVDMTGRRFNRLTVIERAGSKRKRAQWKCRCDCGNIVLVVSDSFRSGNTRSCGCYANEMRVIANTKHGYCGTRLYRIWKGMVARCRNEGSTDFKWYGAKGVSVCNEWLSFDAFRDWALSNGYAENLTLDRVNVYGNYEPSNCRWATVSEQNANRRRKNDG